jgi:surface protein
LFLYKIIQNKDKNINELKNKIDKLKNDNLCKSDKLSVVLDNFDTYYNIINKIINNYEIKYSNYYILKSINNIIDYNKIMIKDIDQILDEKNIENKNNYILNIYDKLRINNEITIRYKLENPGIKRILGSLFVAKNKNNFQLIINDKIYELTYSLSIEFPGNKPTCDIDYNDDLDLDLETLVDSLDIEMEKKDTFEIKLRQIKNVFDISYMFCNCSSLLTIENISNWNTENITNMSGIFSYCNSLSVLPDISNWNTSNVESMNNMFSNCMSLKSLCDISKWDTSNVIDISCMFKNCVSLTSLPDISKWNTNKVTNMNSLCMNCYSLISMPDISKWNFNCKTDISSIFNKCEFLTLNTIINKIKNKINKKLKKN